MILEKLVSAGTFFKIITRGGQSSAYGATPTNRLIEQFNNRSVLLQKSVVDFLDDFGGMRRLSQTVCKRRWNIFLRREVD